MAVPDTQIIFPNVFVPNDINYAALWAAVMTSDYDPTVTAALSYSSADEVTADGAYSTGGKALTGVTVTRDSTEFKIECDDISWVADLTDAACIVFYDPAGTTPVADPVVAIHKFAAVGANSGGTFTHSLPGGYVLRVPNIGG